MNRKPFFLSSWFLVFTLILLCGIPLTISVWPSTASQKEKRIDNTQKDKEYFGPIVDYESANTTLSMTNPEEQKLRRIRSSRYLSRTTYPLDELETVEFAIHTHWAVGLPSLPVAQSDAVVLGKVIDGRAYISSDKMGVYSEFVIQVEKVLKNTGLPIDETLLAEREGGVVRFSSGRTLPYMVENQRLPRVNRTYLLFLRRNAEGGDYHIVTGYEVGQERIAPLDDLDKFAVFKGLNRTSFLNVVQEAISEQSQKKGGMKK